MSFIVVIPARLESTRLPRKALINISGKPLIQYVYETAQQSSASKIIIATDNEEIAQAARNFNAEVVLTSSAHISGSTRIAEVLEKLEIPDETIIVNLQGDEPLMPPACIDQVASLLADHEAASVATLVTTFSRQEDIFDPNVVKVVCDEEGYALYFTRAPVPWQRNSFDTRSISEQLDERVYHRHIGLYAYRAAYLKKYATLNESPLEVLESLEQLRVLWHGDRIITARANAIPGPGVDTESDLHKVESLLMHR